MVKICVGVVAVVVAPLVLWLLIPTLMCLAPVVLLAVPLLPILILRSGRRRSPGASDKDGLAYAEAAPRAGRKVAA